MPSLDPAFSTLSLPKGGGSIRGMGEKFQPGAFDGTGRCSIPIATSPSRAGFGPQLSLEYSTGNGNGPFGLGWNLGIPSVTRKTDKGLPRYDGNDVFVISGTEDLVPVDSGSPLGPARITRGAYVVQAYRPRTEGLFARIERWTRVISTAGLALADEHWRVVTKENVTSLYGRTDNARISNPDNAEHVFQWLLQETFDSKGNHVVYEYAEDDPSQGPNEIYEVNRTAAQRYIRRIFYGNLPGGLSLTHPDGSTIGVLRQASDPADPSRTIGRRYSLEVVFDYGDWQLPFNLSREQIEHRGYRAAPANAEIFGNVGGIAIPTPARQDAFSSFRAGFEVRTRRLCRRVLTYHHFQNMVNPVPVRATCFAHRATTHSQLALLESVTLAGFRPESTAAGAQLVQRTLPASNLKYSQFRPHEQRFVTVSARDNQLPPVSLQHPEFGLVDLFGDGMPDVLHAGAQGYRYWRNLGAGTLEMPRIMTTVNAALQSLSPGAGGRGGVRAGTLLAGLRYGGGTSGMIRHNRHPEPVHSHSRRFSMKLVTAMSAAALVLAPAAGLAQAPTNGAGNTKDQPGVVEKVIGTITGRPPGTKEGADAKSGDSDSAAKSAGSTNYPDWSKVKKTDK